MSTDSDLAFGEPPSPGWTQGLRPDGRLRSRHVRVTPSLLEASGDSSPQSDRLPFGLSLASSGRTQSVPLARNQTVSSRLYSTASIDRAIARLAAQGQQLLADQVTPLRLASHLSVLAVAALILILSQVDIPAWEVSLRLLPSSVQTASTTAGSRVSAFTSGPATASLAGQESLQRSAIPFTIVHEEPLQEIQEYIVQPGDTVMGIANKFGLRPETVQWSNPDLERHVDLIRPGDRLAIPPVDGAIHTVAAGDTLSSLASRYKVTVEDILGYAGNGLADATVALIAGQKLVIPGGSRPFVQQYAIAYSGTAPATAKIGSGSFVWPASGPINQLYWSGHPAIDIGGWIGAPVKATDAGYVALAASGWNSGYGNHVIIDHGNGFSTLYAHLNSIYVRSGESVSKGQEIGSLGSTGNSTGPHLHVEIRYQGVPRNPMSYLP